MTPGTAKRPKRTRPRRRLALIALAAAALAALIGPASAQALGFQTLSAQPANLQAGANTDFNISITFSSASDDVKDLTIGLPPGLVGNPTVTPLCTVAQLNADTCPAASDVGNVTTDIAILGLLPVGVPGDLYNLTPNPGEPARFGIVLRPLGDPLASLLGKVFLQSGAELRQSDFGLNTVIKDIPNTTPGLVPVPIDITGMAVSLAGTAGNPPGGFIRNPTSCVPAAASFTATSYTGATSTTPVTGQAPSFTPTGCGGLPFAPAFSARIGAPGQTSPGGHPALTTTIEQAAGEAGMRRAQVLLPPLIGADLAVLAQTCPEDYFQVGLCPANSIVGTANASSPLLSGPLSGPLILITNPGNLPKVGLDLTGPMALKIKGAFVIGSSPGLEFNGLPDIPISRFTVSFRAGGLVTTPTYLCDGQPRIFNTTFEGHNGTVRSGSTAAALEDCVSPPSKKCKRKAKRKGKHRAGTAKKKKRKCKRRKKRKR